MSGPLKLAPDTLDEMRALLDNAGAEDSFALIVTNDYGTRALMTAPSLSRKAALAMIHMLSDEENWT